MAKLILGLGRAYVGLVLVFLYVPVAVMMVMAFNESPLYKLPIEWSLVWFERLLDDGPLLRSAGNSVGIALATMAIATVLGGAAALGLARYRFRGAGLLRLLLLPPIAIPWIITGTAMLVLFFWIGLGRGLVPLLLGHVALAMPYAIVVTSARLATQGVVLEEAAATLGAAPWYAFRRVTLPQLAPGLVASAVFSFAISFDQFVVSYFLAAPGFSTLPVDIYSAIRKGFTPEINAVASVVIVVSTGLIVLLTRFYKFGGER